MWNLNLHIPHFSSEFPSRNLTHPAATVDEMCLYARMEILSVSSYNGRSPLCIPTDFWWGVQKMNSSSVPANCWAKIPVQRAPSPYTTAHPSATWAVGMAATSFNLLRRGWHILCQYVSHFTRQEITYLGSVPGSERRMWLRGLIGGNESSFSLKDVATK